MPLESCARSVATRITTRIPYSVVGRVPLHYFSSSDESDANGTHHFVNITYSSSDSSSFASSSVKSCPRLVSNSMELVDGLLQRTSEMLDPNAANVIAFSGGVDSSLVAALVYRIFHNDNNRLASTEYQPKGSVQAVLGVSPAVPETQIKMARTVAQTIGIELTEVPTSEGKDEIYVKNDGHACFVCKTHLYSTLETVANSVMKQHHHRQQCKQIADEKDYATRQDSLNYRSVILYNGTNADDRTDPTRLGLIAASNFRVYSPLDQITKAEVRAAAKYMGLPNWNAAASPCLRSRLAIGVLATSNHLRAVEKAEEFVRNVLKIDETVNARVRMLAGGKAVVELDNSILMHEYYFPLSSEEDDGSESRIATVLRENGFETKCINDWGFSSFGGVRQFKTGSVAAMPKTKN